MGFPASQETLEGGLKKTRIMSAAIKVKAQTLRAMAVTQPVERHLLTAFMSQLSVALDFWQEVRALDGIAAYAQSQFGDATLDVAAEFVAMETEAISIRDWIFANFPKAGTPEAWLLAAHDARGNPVQLTFSVSELAPFVTRADALIATIE